jgi:Flp pilus assembly protein TadD
VSPQSSDIRHCLLKAAAVAALALAAAALSGCGSFGDRTGSVRPAGAAAAPSSEEDLRAYAEASRARYERNPGEKTASIDYARALRKLTRTSEAVAVMQVAAVKAPKDEQVLGEYGKALADDGQLAQAKDVLSRAYTPDDPKWDVLSVQGAVADRMGDHDAAMAFYREALKIAPNEPGVLTNMGLSLALTKQLPEAERVLRQAAASPAADATTRGDLALVLGLEGKYAEAERVGETDLSPEAARANVEAVKRMAVAGGGARRPTSVADPASASGSP